MREKDGRVSPLQAPIRGWNKKDPLPAVPEGFALNLDNLFPAVTGVKLRGGTTRLTTTASTSSTESIMPHNQADGTHDLVIASDNDLDTVNFSSGARTSVKGATTITSDKWQHLNYKGRLFICNGADRVLSRTTGNFAAAGFTVSASPDDDLTNIGLYSGALWFTQKDSTEVLYAAAGNITGALTAYDPGIYLKKGGSIIYASGHQQNIGDRKSEMMVMISSEGEILTFIGASPSFTSWDFIGRHEFPEPLGLRSFSF